MDGNKGFVKIGFTTQSIKGRGADWTFKCNRIATILYPTSQSAMCVENIKRVEELCHAELEHRRVMIYCEACQKVHIEWFEMSSEEAISVIRKWTMWMATGPYRNGALREEVQRAGNIDQFMIELASIL